MMNIYIVYTRREHPQEAEDGMEDEVMWLGDR